MIINISKLRNTRKLNNTLNVRNERLNNAIKKLENQMDSNKDLLFDKDYVKIKKDTFDSMNNMIKETKKIMEVQPKLQQVIKVIIEIIKIYSTKLKC